MAEARFARIESLLGRSAPRPLLPGRGESEAFRACVYKLDRRRWYRVFEPEDSSKIPVGPDGNKIGIFMIHGGGGDHRGLIPRARLLASKFGIKVVTMTYPGQLYLLDPSRNWPGSTIHFGSTHQLAQAARAAAKRLTLSAEETQTLIDKYVFYSRELWGNGVKPVPPIIFGIALASGDHTPERYKAVTLPMYAAMDPPPKVSLVEFKAGTHGYSSPEPDLPMGVLPAVAKLWYDAIMNGYYLDYALTWREVAGQWEP